jgi:hypothetical protein
VTLCPKVWWTEILKCLTLTSKTLRPLATVSLHIIRRFVLKWIRNAFLKTASLSTCWPNIDEIHTLDSQCLDRISVGAISSKTEQTGPGAHPATCTMVTGCFLREKRPGRGVDRPPHLAPRLNKEYSCASTPTLGLRGLF